MPNIKLIFSEAAYTVLHSQRIARESFQCIFLSGLLNDDLKQKQIIVEIEETWSLLEKEAKKKKKSPWKVGKLKEYKSITCISCEE